MVDCKVEVNGRPVVTEIVLDGGFRLVGLLPDGVEGPSTTITITAETVEWQDLHPETADRGRRGIAIGWLTLCPARPMPTST